MNTNMKRIKNNVGEIFGGALVACLFLGAMPAYSQQQAAFHPEFYPFHNGMRFNSPEEGMRLIKELGYQGVGSGKPGDLAAYIDAAKKERLKNYSVYLGGKVNERDFSYGKDVTDSIELLKGTEALIEINLQRGPNSTDEQAIAMMKEIGDKAKAAGLKVVIYPHADCHVERVDHAFKIAKATGCDNVGVAFNLCHFLKVQPKDDLAATLTAVKPLLWSVSISGADSDGKDWNTLIRPLDEGTFDTSVVIKHLRDIGFKGAIGLQCFNIRIDPKENLTRSIQAWKKHLAASQGK